MSRVIEGREEPVVNHDAEKAAIDQVVTLFFSAFDNRDCNNANLDLLGTVFARNSYLSKTCGDPLATTGLSEFIDARRDLLNGGELRNFSEREICARTDVFGSVAQRLCVYEKSGVLRGEIFTTRGMKSIQLAKIDDGWKIVSVIWDDERHGFSVSAFIDEIHSTC